MKVERLITFLRGRDTPMKKDVLNKCLLLFSQLCLKKAFRRCQFDRSQNSRICTIPAKLDGNYFQNAFCQFWRTRRYVQINEFQGKGKHLYNKLGNIRSDLGTKPMASTFDRNYQSKCSDAIKQGKFDPLNDYTQHTMMLWEELVKTLERPPLLMLIHSIFLFLSTDGKYTQKSYCL